MLIVLTIENFVKESD